MDKNMRYTPHIAALMIFSFSALSAYGAGTGTMHIMGGSVSGIGTISGTVSVGAGGSVSPGATTGTLDVDGALNVSAMADGGTGKLIFSLDGLTDNNDKITTAGTLTIGVGKLGFSDFTFTDLGDLEVGTYTLITSSGINPGDSLDATNLSGTLSGFTCTITISGGNITLVVSDTTPPTLSGSDIVDNQSGGPIDIGTLVTYTVSFSEDMNAGSVSAADFGNAGTCGVTIGTITESSPGVFTIQVTPTGSGTLILRVNAGAVLTDVAGNALDTASAIADNTTITIRTAYVTWSNGYLPTDVSNPAGNIDSDSLTNLQEFAFGTNPTAASSSQLSYVPGGEVTPGLPKASNVASGPGVDFRAVFCRRKDYVAAGLTYTVQFSAGLDVWVDSNATPTVLTSSTGSVEAVSVPYPFFIATARGVEKPTFFRIAITHNP